MKKIIFLAFVLGSTLLTTSCSSDESAPAPSSPTDPQPKLPVVGTATISNTTFTQTTYSVPIIVNKGIDARSIKLLVDTTYVAPAAIANYTPHFNNADRVLDTNYGNSTLTSGQDSEKTFNITCTITGNPGDNWRVYLSYITSTSSELRYSTVSNIKLHGYKIGNIEENGASVVWKVWNSGHNATVIYKNPLLDANQFNPPFGFKGFYAGTSVNPGQGPNNTDTLRLVQPSWTQSFNPNGYTYAIACYNFNPQCFVPSLGDLQEMATKLKYIFKSESDYTSSFLYGKTFLTSSEVNDEKVYTLGFGFWNQVNRDNPVIPEGVATMKYITSAALVDTGYRVFVCKNITWPS